MSQPRSPGFGRELTVFNLKGRQMVFMSDPYVWIIYVSPPGNLATVYTALIRRPAFLNI